MARQPLGLQSFLFIVQSLSRVSLFATPWTAALGFSVHHQLPEFAQTHVHSLEDAIQPPQPSVGGHFTSPVF